MNIFERTRKKRDMEGEKASGAKPAASKESSGGPTQADFFYGSSSDLKKKGETSRPPQSRKWTEK